MECESSMKWWNIGLIVLIIAIIVSFVFGVILDDNVVSVLDVVRASWISVVACFLFFPGYISARKKAGK